MMDWWVHGLDKVVLGIIIPLISNGFVGCLAL